MNDSLTGTLTGNQLTTLSYVLEHRGIPLSAANASITSFIDRSINEVSARFERVCYKYLAQRTLSGIYSGNGCNELRLRNTPVHNVTAIRYRATLSSPWELLSVPFAIVSRYKIVFEDRVFMKGLQNYLIEYSAGYNPIPYDLQELATDAVAIKIKEANLKGISQNILGEKSRQSDSPKSFSTTHTDLRDREKAILKNYRKL